MKIFFSFLCCFLLATPIEARPPTCKAKNKTSKIADAGKKIMPIGASVISLARKDWLGAIWVQGIAEGLYVLNHNLEKKIHKKRPCGCNGAFPSGHMIMFASGASYLHYRYGWHYGLPAYVAMLGFSYDRVRCKAHSWGDMLATAAIVNLVAFVATRRYTPEVEYLPPCFFPSCDPKEGLLRSKALRERKQSFTQKIIPTFQTGKGHYSVGFIIKL